jgi:hypothetical protein
MVRVTQTSTTPRPIHLAAVLEAVVDAVPDRLLR